MNSTLFENAPNGYFAFDDEARLLLVNETLSFILERPKGELIGKNVDALFTLPTRIFFQTHLFPMIKLHGGAEEIFVTLLSAKGNHLPVLLNAKKIELEGKTINCCSCIHVPNRKKFEDELISARKTAETALQENTELLKTKAELQLRTEELDKQIQLVRSQNYELRQFSHVVSHNLKEPLRKILMYTSKLIEETDAPSVSKLIKSAEQMRAIVSGLQQYVWLNEKKNEYTSVNLNELTEEVSMQLRHEIDPVGLVIQYDPIPIIEGDKEQLKMLLRQLLLNAVKFRKGDSVLVKVEVTVIKKNRFRFVENKYEYHDFVRLEILDDGIGFDSMYSGQVFELFRKLHQSEGLGLGLALCKKIVENHSGHIEAESELGQYTKVTVLLPLVQSSS